MNHKDLTAEEYTANWKRGLCMLPVTEEQVKAYEELTKDEKNRDLPGRDDCFYVLESAKSPGYYLVSASWFGAMGGPAITCDKNPKKALFWKGKRGWADAMQHSIVSIPPIFGRFRVCEFSIETGQRTIRAGSRAILDPGTDKQQEVLVFHYSRKGQYAVIELSDGTHATAITSRIKQI